MFRAVKKELTSTKDKTVLNVFLYLEIWPLAVAEAVFYRTMMKRRMPLRAKQEGGKPDKRFPARERHVCCS